VKMVSEKVSSSSARAVIVRDCCLEKWLALTIFSRMSRETCKRLPC